MQCLMFNERISSFDLKLRFVLEEVRLLEFYFFKVNGFALALPKKFISQPAITCSKLTIETLEQGVKYVQS